MIELADIENLDLPYNPTMSAMMELIGEQHAVLLAAEFSGQRIYFPRKVKNCKIARKIGYEALERIVAVYGGMMMEVPVSIGRKAAVARLLNRDCSVMDVVTSLHCTRNYVYKVKKEMQNDGIRGLFDISVNIDRDQLSLFD